MKSHLTTWINNLQQAIFSQDPHSPEFSIMKTLPEQHLPPSSATPVRHVLTGMELSVSELTALLDKAADIKNNPANYRQSLSGKTLAMIFEKPSFRTRLSFSLAVQTMGGITIESVSNTRKSEEPADMARVLNGYVDVIMVRTHDDQLLREMAAYARIPIINGLSALHHPCQILADLLTLKEHYGRLDGLTLTYIGDGNNILHSLMLLAPQTGMTIHYCCPTNHQPNQDIVAQARSRHYEAIRCFTTPEEAVHHAHAVYTDVWTSMGFEASNGERDFTGFQVNESLMAEARPEAVFLHCMPMERGQEVSRSLPDSPCSLIFQQSENRMHVQKALLCFLQHPETG
ncbi:ornithine carbamoyltransferase [Legionella spiritensis]|uniref:ornithine carbamoyltransferase n=1 Tax=Legionella spiritensis TaxID=452 RepID=UPI000F81E636|nr:ornithine carbamoyltransferase [Legionella spiritensis]